MLTYQKATELVQSARKSETGRLLENNTRLLPRGSDFAIRLHDTDIVTIHKSGAYTLNSGGWKTATTKARLNDYAPIRISQDKGQWYVAPGLLFADGMHITARGRLTGCGKAREKKTQNNLRKAVAAYAKEYIRRLYAGELPAPSNGDCWGCCMRTAEGDNPMGHGGDHIRGHIREKYYVPSLVLLALNKKGASIAAKHNAAYYLKMSGWENTQPFPGDFIREQISRTLRRYCLQQVGLPD